MSDKKESGLLAAGTILAEQREKLGLSIDECAESLKLSCTKVRALEEGNESPFISDVFIRGYLRSYAKLVQLSEEDILLYYNSQGNDTKPTDEYANTSRDQSQSRWWFPYVVGLLLIAGWFVVSSYLDKDSQWLNDLLGQYSVSEEVSSHKVVKNNIPLKTTETKDESLNVLNDGSNESSTISTAMDSIPASSPIQSPNTQPIVAVNSELSGEAGNETQDQTVISNEAATQFQTGNAQDIMAELERDQVSQPVENSTHLDKKINTTTVTPAESTTLSRLEFRFKEDCWVQVVDANQAIIESSLRDANTSLVVTGEAPFSIILGNIIGTSLEFNGEPVTLANASGGRTLRITVGS